MITRHAFVLLGLFACQTASTPIDPVWDKQSCAACAMLVSDKRFAAQLATLDGARLYFDDPGCMASWISTHPGKAAQKWVRAADGSWPPADQARYVSGAQSPMDYGFAPSPTGTARWDAVVASARMRAEGRTSQ